MIKRYDIGGMPDGGIDVQQFHDGYWVKYEDYAALQQKLDAMAAENAALKTANRIAINILNDEETMVTSLWASSVQRVEVSTPATDAYLNSVRAEGVDMVAEAIGNSAAKLKVGSKDWKALKSIVFTLVNFAEQLRSGTHDTADKAV